MSQNFPLVIIGGNSLVAPYLMRRLHAEFYTAEVISRRPMQVPEGFTFTHMDLTLARSWIAPANATVISLLPLWVLAQLLPRFMGIKAFIAVGSTSVFSKAASADIGERATATRLDLAEVTLHDWCARSHVTSTLLRSTMVYDGINDKNIARMARFIRRYRFLPLAAPATGLRQPIHADDVAKAIVKSLNTPTVQNKVLNIAGGEVLSYRTMAERVFGALDMKPRLLMLPVEWLDTCFQIGSKIGLLNETAFGASIFQRMNQDLIFDVEEGLRLLDYQPRGFAPNLL